MSQLVSYGFTTVENPLSDGGNFSILDDGSTWTGSLEVPTSGQCLGTTSGDQGAIWTGSVPGYGASWPDNQYSEITIGELTGTSYYYAIVRQASTTVNTQYLLSVNYNLGSSQYDVYYAVNNAYVQLIGLTSCVLAVGDVWRISVNGTTISVLQNGTVLNTVTDSNIASGTPGFAIQNISNIVTKWAAGDLLAGGIGKGWLPVNLNTSLKGLRH